MLASKDFLVGDRLIEAEMRLFDTIVRFDPVCAGHFESASFAADTLRSTCGRRGSFLRAVSVESEGALARGRRCRWMQKLYWFNDAFSSTCNFEHIKTRCHSSRPRVRPHSS